MFVSVFMGFLFEGYCIEEWMDIYDECVLMMGLFLCEGGMVIVFFVDDKWFEGLGFDCGYGEVCMCLGDVVWCCVEILLGFVVEWFVM